MDRVGVLVASILLLAGLAVGGLAIYSYAHGGPDDGYMDLEDTSASGSKEYRGYGGMGMGMMDSDDDHYEPMVRSEEEHCHYMKDPMEGYRDMEHWGWMPMEVEYIEGTVVYVDIDDMELTIETSEGEKVELKAAKMYVNMEDGSLTFSPWILAQLEPGDEVEVAVYGWGRWMRLAGIEVGGVEYLHPYLALEQLESG